jgi:hypothetical protein
LSKIPLTGHEARILVEARDLLYHLGSDPLTGGGLASGVADGIKLVLKCAHIDLEKVEIPSNPVFPVLPSLDEIDASRGAAGPVNPLVVKPDNHNGLGTVDQ